MLTSLVTIIGSVIIGLILCFIGWFFYPMIQDANLAAAILIPGYGIFRLLEWIYLKRKKA